MARSTSDGNIRSGDNDGVKVIVKGITEGLLTISRDTTRHICFTHSSTSEGNSGTSLKTLQINGARGRCVEIRQNDVGAGCDGGGERCVFGHNTGRARSRNGGSADSSANTCRQGGLGDGRRLDGTGLDSGRRGLIIVK